MAVFFWSRRAYAGSAPQPARHSIDFDHMTGERRAHFIGSGHMTGGSIRLNTGVRRSRRILTKAWNRRSGEEKKAW